MQFVLLKASVVPKKEFWQQLQRTFVEMRVSLKSVQYFFDEIQLNLEQDMVSERFHEPF